MREDKFCRKLVDAHCQLKQTEPYSPWQNATEREIKELKKGVGRKMLLLGMPCHLWDDCLELEAYICFHSIHSVYHLDGKVPEMYMSGDMADISQYVLCIHDDQDTILAWINKYFPLKPDLVG